MDKSGSRICTLLGFEVAQHKGSAGPERSISQSYDIYYQALGAPQRELASITVHPNREHNVYGVLDDLVANSKV